MLRAFQRWLVVSVVFLASLAGCDRSDQKPAASAAPAPSETAAPSAAAERPSAASAAAGGESAPAGSTGILGEEEFKALHVLTDAQAPKLHGRDVEVGGERAYLSLPKGTTPPIPAVIVIHEWWGLNEHIKHWADRLAAEGYAALAVDLYGGKVATNRDDAMSYMKGVDDAKATKTLLFAADYLKKDPGIRAERRASIGWCFGGKWSLNLALAAQDLDAAVVYYGHVTTEAKELQKLKSPLLGVFGNQDQGIPPEMVDRFEASLKQVGAKYDILRYDAHHAFANPSSGRYDQESAEAAWVKVRAFLREKLER